MNVADKPSCEYRSSKLSLALKARKSFEYEEAGNLSLREIIQCHGWCEDFVNEDDANLHLRIFEAKARF